MTTESISGSDLPNPKLRVFISHYFGEDDYPSTLQKILRDNNIAGYMAIKQKQYEVGIDQKIMDAIIASDYLVPILTNNGLGSPSVNQEIGFALGTKTPVIVMIEKDTKKGVFIYGREPEEFTKDNFTEACLNVAKYLVKDGKKKVRSLPTDKPAEEFLTKRRLVDPEREEFTINTISDTLHDFTMKKEHPPNTAKRLIVFSACPKYLLEDIDITSENTRKWLSENAMVRDGNFRFNFLPPSGRPRINLNSLTYKWFRRNEFLTRYIEFQNNGYLEEGITDPIIRDVPFSGNYHDMHPGLHLSWVTGAYWAFLLFARNYYNFQQMFDEVKVSFNIHNTKDMMLFGFAGTVSENSHWADPTDGGYLWGQNYTDNLNVQVTGTINAYTTNEEIARIVRKVATKLSNAYGMDTPRCYNMDGTFELKLFSHYDPT